MKMNYPYIRKFTIPNYNTDFDLNKALDDIINGRFDWMDFLPKTPVRDENLSGNAMERECSANPFDVIDRNFDIETEKNETGETTSYVIKIEHTPFKKSEIKVSLEGPRLHVKIGNGETRNEKTDKSGRVIARNISRQTSDFSINLTGMNIIRKKISAKCEDGILRIDLPVYPKSSLPLETEIPIG